MNYLDRDTYGMYKTSANDLSAGPDTRHGPGPQLMGADTLNGNDVYNHHGDKLGDIKEIMLNVQSGRVCYAVMSCGGFMGMGEKLFAVPWAALTLDTEHKRFVLKVEKARLESSPGFDKSHWPDMADAQWAASIHEFFGVSPTSDAAITNGKAMGLTPASARN